MFILYKHCIFKRGTKREMASWSRSEIPIASRQKLVEVIKDFADPVE